MRVVITSALISALCSMLGCDGGLLSDPPELLSERALSGGPRVIYDFAAKPLPEIPLPNDDATRYDPSSPTLRRINVSRFASTEVERRAREAFNGLDGFGTYAPITVSFDAPLDVLDLHKRHNLHDPDNGHYRDDFRDDAVYLFNIDPKCERFGEEVALDMGRGRFPVTLFKHLRIKPNERAPEGREIDFSGLFYFSEFDPHALANNLLFEEWDEDLNGNGKLDPGEDRDSDGQLDRPNFLHPEACAEYAEGTLERSQCAADELMSFYERATNTLILRPVWPLEQRCRYAVVLTNRLKGEDGSPVESPFVGAGPGAQADALKRVTPLLSRYDLAASDVAFAWTFTTGTMTKDLEALREGLYGSGVFSELSERFPATSLHVWTRGELDTQDVLPESVKEDRHLPGTCVGIGLSKFWQLNREWDANLCAIEADSSGLSMVFGGYFKAPDLLINRDDNVTATENYPQTADERWEVEAHTGKIVYGDTNVTFWCALPEERDTSCSPGNPEAKPFCKPFPTILYAHGYGGSRAEVTVGHLGRTNSMGYAMCALDGYGHGLNILLGENDFAREISVIFRVLASYGIPDYQELLMRGRDRDLNNDGLPDSGADMWTSDIFHTRDMVRQTTLEYMQFVRILRSFDGEQKDAEGRLLGDIDNDGVVDIAGPKTSIGMWGVSLGGIISGVLAGAEPALDAVSPNAGGAGLVDIAVRSSQQGVPQAVMLPVLGPFVIGCLPQSGDQQPLSAGSGGSEEGEQTGKSCFESEGNTLVTLDGGDEVVPAGDRAELKAGELELAFLLNDNARQREITFARLSDVRVGDWIELHNLSNGERKRRQVDVRGRIMISIPADALQASERRGVIGLGDEDREPVEYQDTLRLGDQLVIRHYRGDAVEEALERDPETGEYDVSEPLDVEPLYELKEFMWPLSFHGTIYPAKAPLVALQEGLGLDRNDAAYRRFMGLAQTAIGPGDPAIWSIHVSEEPLEINYNDFKGGHTHVLQMPTVGDTQVPTSTGIAAARAMGALGSWRRDESKDPRFGWRELFEPLERESEDSSSAEGLSADQLLIERYVVEGDAELERWGEAARERAANDPDVVYEVAEGESLHPVVLFDIDNVSDGQARFSCSDEDWSAMNGEFKCPDEWRDEGRIFPVPHDPRGLRLTKEREEGRYDGLRVPMLRPVGQHGIYNAQPFRVFDADAFMVNFTTRYLGTRGAAVDHPAGCDCSASGIPQYFIDSSEAYPIRGSRMCEPVELRMCNAECAEAWGIVTSEQAACETLP